MKYVEYINALIRQKVLETEGMVLFGQNINAGSCLSGLTKNLQVQKGGLILNTQNSENTLCGVVRVYTNPILLPLALLLQIFWNRVL